MFGKLVDKWHERAEKIREQRQIDAIWKIPLVTTGRLAIARHWESNHEVIKDFSEGLVRDERDALMTHVIEIATSPNPRMRNREFLATAVTTLALYQVLVMEPPPAEDDTGLRGHCGITGELKERLLEIADKHKEIREYMHGFAPVQKFGDVYDRVLFRYRILYARSLVYYELTKGLEDYNAERDWFKPFLVAFAGWQEGLVRFSIGMQPALDTDVLAANFKGLALSSFLQCVLDENVRYPDLKFIENIKRTNPDWYEQLKPVY